MNFFQDLTMEQALALFDHGLSQLDDETFFNTLGTSVAQLRDKAAVHAAPSVPYRNEKPPFLAQSNVCFRNQQETELLCA